MYHDGRFAALSNATISFSWSQKNFPFFQNFPFSIFLFSWTREKIKFSAMKGSAEIFERRKDERPLKIPALFLLTWESMHEKLFNASFLLPDWNLHLFLKNVVHVLTINYLKSKQTALKRASKENIFLMSTCMTTMYLKLRLLSHEKNLYFHCHRLDL